MSVSLPLNKKGRQANGSCLPVAPLSGHLRVFTPFGGLDLPAALQSQLPSTVLKPERFRAVAPSAVSVIEFKELNKDTLSRGGLWLSVALYRKITVISRYLIVAMLLSIPFNILASCLVFALTSLAAQAGSGVLSLQYGGDFDDQDQVFVDVEFSVLELGYINLGVGASEYQYNSNVAVTTDYYSVGYSSSREKDFVAALGYDYWQREKLQADSWRADFYLYRGGWRIGLHPEWHAIVFTSNKGDVLEFSNQGGGFSLGYSASDNLYLYGDYYRYQFNMPPGLLNRFRFLPLRVRIALRLLANEVSSEFDDKRTTLGVNYYFDTASIGIERQQITSVIDEGKYDITSFSASLILDDHWLAGLRISDASGSDNRFYSFTLSYDWY